jgi:hypothetical protein
MPDWKDLEGDRRRRQPRLEIRLDCVLTRRKGAPIVCHTLDLGPGGMRVATDRPLGVDEVLHFDLAPVKGQQVDGDARVLREQGPNVYALRIETIRDEMAQRLGTLASG